MRRKEFLASLTTGIGLLPAAHSFGAIFPGAPAPDAAAAPLSPGAAPAGQQRIHQDFVTFVPGIEYFHLGNGDIQAVVQYAPDRAPEMAPTFFAVTVMSPEHFTRKWSTFLFHPERGFERTGMSLVTGNTTYAARPETLQTIGWKYPQGIPTVSVEWKAGECRVAEELFVPAEGALLFRRVTVTNGSDHPVNARVAAALVPNFALFDDISTDTADQSVNARGFATMRLVCLEKGATTSGRYELSAPVDDLQPGKSVSVRFVYSIEGAEKVLDRKGWAKMLAEAEAYWASKNQAQTGHPTLDRFYALSRTGIKAMVSRTGKRDGGFWEYQMEWVGDDAMAMLGMLQAGLHAEARVVLLKMLQRSIGPDGRTVEAGRLMPLALTEFVQNGIFLYALWTYACWTGDMATIRKYWHTIQRIADFPLHDVFRDAATGLLHNKREWWERSDQFGFEEGYELAYQFWVAIGLEKASELSRGIGDAASAKRWGGASNAIKHAILHDEKFRMIEDGHLIKRRTLDGRWQQVVKPPDRKSMPPGSPMATETDPCCEPDTSTVWPVIFGMVHPDGDVAARTLDWMEQLWSQRWATGGYPRYNTTSEPDPPAPWPIASMLVARAYAETGNGEKVWRVINWLKSIHGGISGGWFERYGQSITPPAPPVGVIGWVWEEIVSLVVYHLFGFRPELDRIVIRPRLLNGLDHMQGKFRVRSAVVAVDVTRSRQAGAVVNSRDVPLDGEGSLILPYRRLGKRVEVQLNIL